MLVAMNEERCRINASEANKKEKYFCPVCNEVLILKNGEINIAHFAHKNRECIDNWHYDMSEWHRKKQNYFDIKYQEIILEKDYSKKRADILKDGVVIEFQHSPISASEFNSRNGFYTSCGYKVAWVFDVTEQINNEELFWNEYSSKDNIMKWKYPMRILKEINNLRINNNVSVWLNWDYQHVDEDSDDIYRITWSSKDENSVLYNFKNIAVSNPIPLIKDMDLKELFYSEYKKNINELKKQGMRYEIKKIGEKGYRRKSYVCPSSKKFGLRIYGEEGCNYCPYCFGYTEYKCGKYNIYCCYPNKVSDKVYR